MQGSEISAEIRALDGDTAGLPIGPGSLTWRLLGDRRLLLFLGRTGTLQNMHPAVGAALQDHSNFFDDPWDRLLRSIPQILGVIYDVPEQRTALTVRDFHKNLKGTDPQGRRYHALSPDVFWWTHATFIEVLIAMEEHFGTPLSPAEKNQLIAEGITWWQQYGMSMAPVLTDYAEFTAYWDRMLTTALESNATTDYAVSVSNRRIPAPPGVPAALWVAAQRPVMTLNVWLLTALMPERGREILELSWNRRDQLAFRVFAGAVRRTWPLLPERVRFFPRAYESIRGVRTGRHGYGVLNRISG
ncbi:oxygenase MpaB family protein [Nocardia sp. NPDC006630]|uniref:oxygenase MpaB family protein n=1 Tax=Nocardia sp. NPDC006630 TaxID=3157181 RepID=UPI0033B96AB5